MRDRRIKTLLASIMLIIMVMSLSACGLFARRQIADAKMSVASGLEVSSVENQYEATLGANFKLQLSWTAGTTNSPKIVWYVAVDEGERAQIEGQTQKTLSYTIAEYSASTYTFSAAVDEIEATAPVVVTVKYATLKMVEVSSSTSVIIQDVIQQNFDDISEIDLSVSWDSTYFAPGYDETLTVQWYVDGVASSGATSKNFKYLPKSPTEGETSSKAVLSARVSFGAGSEDYVEHSVTVSVLRAYKAVDKVSIAATANADYHEKGYYTQFASGSSPYSEITLELDVLPTTGTNLKAAAVWSHRTESGVIDLEATAREITVALAPGKNVFSATVDNVASREITVYALSEEGFNSKKAVIDETFIWGGNIQSGYIMDITDLSVFVSYLVSEHKINNAKDIYLQHDAWKNGGEATDAFKTAVSVAMGRIDESGMFNIGYNALQMGVVEGGPTVDEPNGEKTAFGFPEGKYPTPISVTQKDVLTHFSTSEIARTELPIDKSTDTMRVADSNMLFRAVSWGYKPMFATDANGVQLGKLYATAREVLCDINDDKMSEYEKVRAIYEWILTNVAYDYKVAEAEGTGENLGEHRIINYNAFYLEGVFNDKLAVCDGKSKAFALLCGMEGISAVRLTGIAKSSGGGHAWNKVLVDTNNDGVREWYAVDTTWGDAASKTDDNNYVEATSMQYFLISDASIDQTHEAHQPQPKATTEYDYYAHTFVFADGVYVSIKITTEAQLKALLDYSAANGNVWIEVENAVESAQTQEEFRNLCVKSGAKGLIHLTAGNGGLYILKK